MSKQVRKVFASLCATAMLMVAAVSPAAAQQQQDGLVNVAIGDITVEDVNVGVAAVVAATVCDVNVGPVAVLGRAVDRSEPDTSRTVCTIGDDSIRLIQN